MELKSKSKSLGVMQVHQDQKRSNLLFVSVDPHTWPFPCVEFYLYELGTPPSWSLHRFKIDSGSDTVDISYLFLRWIESDKMCIDVAKF